MLNPEPYYHKTTQNVLAAFGTVFNNLRVCKYINGSKADTARVPISLGASQKWLKRIKEREDLESNKIATKLPRMSYDIAAISEDSQRRLSKQNKWRFGDNTDTGETQYMEVPYTMDINLSIYAKTQDEGFQLIEQILPYFNPDFTLSVKGLYGPSEKRTNLPIILTGVDTSLEYEGTGEDRNLYQWTLSFTIKFSYAGRVMNQALIRTAQVDITSDSEGESVTAAVVGVNDTELNFDSSVTIDDLIL